MKTVFYFYVGKTDHSAIWSIQNAQDVSAATTITQMTILRINITFPPFPNSNPIRMGKSDRFLRFGHVCNGSYTDYPPDSGKIVFFAFCVDVVKPRKIVCHWNKESVQPVNAKELFDNVPQITDWQHQIWRLAVLHYGMDNGQVRW